MTAGADSIRECLEGVVPSVVATCSAEGVPNVCYLSQIEYVDAEHVALSFQFFNKTRANVLANPYAVAMVVEPETAAAYRLHLHYLRTETSGPVFERMKAKLASIASATGMSAVFRLQGSDIYRVDRIERAPGRERVRVPRRARLPALRACSDALSRANDLDALFQTLLASLAEHFGIQHAMVLVLDQPGERFFAVASRGYGNSGIGAEIPVGMGAVGIAAARKVAVRVAFANAEYAYVRAIRDRAAQDPAWARRLENEIPAPGLLNPHSQLAVPLEVGDAVLGVLYVESAEILRFTYEDEDALVALCRQVALAMRVLDADEDRVPPRNPPLLAPSESAGPALVIKHFASNDSIFLGDDYLIKGVAGAIFRKLVRAFVNERRCDFVNRELRLDKGLGLPELADNLESRLVLLQRRLAERDQGVRLEKTGRGRFRLSVERRLELVELP
ncbi:MAG TPA: GAF domain-containing protein [Polyangiales bacterium]|nr:GAF domain-containing protein [Polyangiales bacterium]